MHQVSAPGQTWHPYPSIAPSTVMKVYTVTILDETGDGGCRRIGVVQHRRTLTYDRCARTVASVPPAVIDIRL